MVWPYLYILKTNKWYFIKERMHYVSGLDNMGVNKKKGSRGWTTRWCRSGWSGWTRQRPKPHDINIQYIQFIVMQSLSDKISRWQCFWRPLEFVLLSLLLHNFIYISCVVLIWSVDHKHFTEIHFKMWIINILSYFNEEGANSVNRL